MTTTPAACCAASLVLHLQVCFESWSKNNVSHSKEMTTFCYLEFKYFPFPVKSGQNKQSTADSLLCFLWLARSM